IAWPLCCGPACAAASRPCTNGDHVCWLIGDGVGGILDIGFCLSDVEAANPDGPDLRWTCDCASPPGPMGEVCQWLP
ncbi:MAG TPA: hypothetical protein VGA44_04615, partial [Steroidobacteraceae bacterium]